MRAQGVLPFIAVAGLLLAGCTGSTQPTTTNPPPPEPSLPEHPETTFYHFAGAVPADPALLVGNNTAFSAAGGYSPIGATTFEPSIGANLKTNSLFMTSYGGLGSGTRIIRGTQNGTVWEDVGPSLAPGAPSQAFPNSNDPYLYVDPWTGRVIDFDMCAILSGFCTYISDDDGETWLMQTIATGEQPALDHQSVAAAPATEATPTVGYPNVLVFCVNRGTTTTGSWCSSSFDGGIAWTPLAPGFPVGVQQCSGLSGHVHGAADGRFYRGNPSCEGPAVYRSDDGGLTWSEHTVNRTTGSLDHDIEVAIDEGGHVYAFWIGNDGLPYLAASNDLGETWGPAMMVAPPGVTATGFPATAAGADGRVVVAYIGSTVEEGYDGKAVPGRIAGPMPLITTVTVNDPASDPLQDGSMCGAIRCGGFGDFIDVTIDAVGRPWAAMANNEHGEEGIAVTTVDGPSLRGPLAPLPHLEVQGPAGFA